MSTSTGLLFLVVVPFSPICSSKSEGYVAIRSSVQHINILIVIAPLARRPVVALRPCPQLCIVFIVTRCGSLCT